MNIDDARRPDPAAAAGRALRPDAISRGGFNPRLGRNGVRPFVARRYVEFAACQAEPDAARLENLVGDVMRRYDGIEARCGRPPSPWSADLPKVTAAPPTVFCPRQVHLTETVWNATKVD